MLSMTPAVRLFLLVNLAVALLVWLNRSQGTDLIALLACQREPVLTGEVWRLLTAGFCHADVMHLLFNMLGLLYFAAPVEKFLGSRGFAVVILATILLGNGIHLLVSAAPCVGFSGANLAIFTLFACLAPRHPVSLLFIPIPIPAWLLLLIMVGLDLFGALGSLASPIAHAVHLTGVVIGLAVFFGRRRFIQAKDRVFGLRVVDAPHEDESFHRCAVCGATERSDPGLGFRVCTRCQPPQEYCDRHRDGHAHRGGSTAEG